MKRGKEKECKTEVTKIVKSLEHTTLKKFREIGMFGKTRTLSGSSLQLLERNLWFDWAKLFALEANIKRSSKHLLQLWASDEMLRENS